MNVETQTTPAAEAIADACIARLAEAPPEPSASHDEWMDYLVAVGIAVDAVARRSFARERADGARLWRAEERSAASATATLGMVLAELEPPAGSSVEVANTIASYFSEYAVGAGDASAAHYAVLLAANVLHAEPEEAEQRLLAASTILAAAPILPAEVRDAQRAAIREAERALYGPSLMEQLQARFGNVVEAGKLRAQTVVEAVTGTLDSVSEELQSLGAAFAQPTLAGSASTDRDDLPSWSLAVRHGEGEQALEIRISPERSEEKVGLKFEVSSELKADPTDEIPVTVLMEVGVLDDERTHRITIDGPLLHSSADSRERFVLAESRLKDDIGDNLSESLRAGAIFARVVGVRWG